MYTEASEYEVDKVIAIADKVIKVYGYCNTKGLDRLARLLKEKSDHFAVLIFVNFCAIFFCFCVKDHSVL